jgi:hypothetical protein
MKEKSFVTLSPGVFPAKMYSNLVKIKNRFFSTDLFFTLLRRSTLYGILKLNKLSVVEGERKASAVEAMKKMLPLIFTFLRPFFCVADASERWTTVPGSAISNGGSCPSPFINIK